MPRVITTDKYYTYEVLINELIYSSDLSCRTQHRQIQYLNNIVEQDHRFIKKITNPMLGFKNFKSACYVISGIETFHMLRKNQVGMMTPIQEVEFIHQNMNVGQRLGCQRAIFVLSDYLHQNRKFYSCFVFSLLHLILQQSSYSSMIMVVIESFFCKLWISRQFICNQQFRFYS